MSIVVGGGKWQVLKQEVLQRKPGTPMSKPSLNDLCLHAKIIVSAGQQLEGVCDEAAETDSEFSVVVVAAPTGTNALAQTNYGLAGKPFLA